MALSPLRPGDPAPDFRLPAIHREGEVSVADYRSRSPLLLALFRGLYCPFCRRAIAQLGLAATKLEAAGVPTLAVVATPLDRARLYFRHRPAPRLALAADPDLTTLRAFRVPKGGAPPERMMEEAQAARTTLGGILAEPLSIPDAARLLEAQHPIELTPLDQADAERQFGQFVGQFLIDREGIIRWVNIEGAGEGFAGIGAFPTDDELLAAVESSRIAP
jgi:peroxiredoxin